MTLAPHDVARQAGLRYVRNQDAGLTRRRCGRGFTYENDSGNTVRDPQTRARIDDLVIPPAWTEVWICADPAGHIQATGRDDRGRKQYIYHPAWREVQDQLKFARMLPFGMELPRLRSLVGRHLRQPGIPFEKVASAAVRVLDVAAIRVGSDRYAVANNSFGLTTLRRRHLDFSPRTLTLEFEAKGGRETQVPIQDETLIGILRELEEVPGYRVFQYRDESGNKRNLDADDVNEFMAESLDAGFSAKDFRTWAGNRRAISALARGRYPESTDEREERIRTSIAEVAEVLGNTPAVARSSYVDPRIVETYRAGDFERLYRDARGRAPSLAVPGRRKSERLALALLEALED